MGRWCSGAVVRWCGGGEAIVGLRVAWNGFLRGRFSSVLCVEIVRLIPSPVVQKYNLQVDIWSLGVVFYVCLCGYPPFADEIPWHNLPIEEQIVEGKWRFDPGEPWNSISQGGASRPLLPPPTRARTHTAPTATRPSIH